MTKAQVELVRELVRRERDYHEALRDNDIQRTGLPVVELYGPAIRTGRTLEAAGLVVMWMDDEKHNTYCKLVDSGYPGIPA